MVRDFKHIGIAFGAALILAACGAEETSSISSDDALVEQVDQPDAEDIEQANPADGVPPIAGSDQFVDEVPEALASTESAVMRVTDSGFISFDPLRNTEHCGENVLSTGWAGPNTVSLMCSGSKVFSVDLAAGELEVVLDTAASYPDARVHIGGVAHSDSYTYVLLSVTTPETGLTAEQTTRVLEVIEKSTLTRESIVIPESQDALFLIGATDNQVLFRGGQQRRAISSITQLNLADESYESVEIDWAYVSGEVAIAAGLDGRGFPDADIAEINLCLLYTSPSPRDRTRSRMPSSA